MAKRSGQWIGDSTLITVLTNASGGVGSVIQLLPSVVDTAMPRDVVHERTIISFQSRRISTGDLEGFAYVVWKGDVLSGTSTPTEALDPLSLSSFSWAHKSIMHFGPLKVPPLLVQSDDTFKINSEVTAEQVEVVVKRKVGRANEGIFLVVASDLSSRMKCLVTSRTYYTYA